jgi:hypothetical protein
MFLILNVRLSKTPLIKAGRASPSANTSHTTVPLDKLRKCPAGLLPQRSGYRQKGRTGYSTYNLDCMETQFNQTYGTT